MSESRKGLCFWYGDNMPGDRCQTTERYKTQQRGTLLSHSSPVCPADWLTDSCFASLCQNRFNIGQTRPRLRAPGGSPASDRKPLNMPPERVNTCPGGKSDGGQEVGGFWKRTAGWNGLWITISDPNSFLNTFKIFSWMLKMLTKHMMTFWDWSFICHQGRSYGG